MVDENVEGDAEIAWLESEMEGLQPHTPDALAELEVQVTFLPIFCCCDGKTINGQLKNRWTKRCPFCDSTPSDRLKGIKRPTKAGHLKNLQTAPLHVLLRTGEGFFNTGFRLKAGIFKYNVGLDEYEKQLEKER